MVAVGGHPRPTRWLPSAPRRPEGARRSPTHPLLANAWLIATAVSLGALVVVTVDAVRGDAEPAPSSEVASGPASAATPVSAAAGALSGDTVESPTTASAPTIGATTGAPTATDATSATVDSGSASTAAAAASVPQSAAVSTTAAGSVTPTANQVTAGPQGGDRPVGGSAGSATASCGDAAGDPTTDGLSDVDLLGVELRRDATGLVVRFDLNGAVPPNTAPVGGAPSTSLWQVLLANGDTVLYAFSVTQQGTTWETNLVDFTSSSGDRIGTIAAPTGNTVEALIPADSLGLLPNTFTWWALTSTDRQAPSGSYIGDDCPNGTGDIEAGLALPAEATRSTFAS